MQYENSKLLPTTKRRVLMKHLVSILVFGFALAAMADEGFVQQISVRGQGYYPDRITADAVCFMNGIPASNGFTQWRQAGNKIEGLRSYDGRNFSRDKWGGGMALDTVSCSQRRQPTQVSVRGQSYYPDRYTAQAICSFNGYYQEAGYTQWKQAGDKIEGQRSYDGRPYFQTEIWYGGYALDTVICQ
jgi:hypothetical protein